MKKWNRITGIILILLLVLSLGVPVLAENDRKVVDMYDLLSDAEETELQEQLNKISEKYQCDVVVASSDTSGSNGIETYTDDFYYQNHYGYGEELDGIILMICMEDREFYMATRGKAIRVFTDYGMNQIDERITPYLSDGEYGEAFAYFGTLAEQFLAEYEKTGNAYDVYHTYEDPIGLGMRLGISAAAGAVVALIVWLVLFGQLKTVAPEKKAHEYVRNGSFHITKERDVFLYRNVMKRKIERDSGGGGSSTHRTSDGGRAGGHKGSF